MLRFALFSPPDEGPPLFKDHLCVNRRVVSQEGDYCTRMKKKKDVGMAERFSIKYGNNDELSTTPYLQSEIKSF